MFHLDHDADTPPETDAQLREAVLGTLRNELTLEPNRRAVHLEDGELDVELTGARVSTDVPPKKPAPAGPRRAGPAFGRLRVHAEPMALDEAALRLRLEARDVRCVYDRDADDGRWLLMLDDVADGEVEAAIPLADLRTLIERKVREGAAQKGVTVESVDLDLTQAGPRSMGVRATVRGSKKVAFVNAPFAADVTGTLSVDDELEGRLSDLRVDGHGKVMAVLAGLVEPKLRELERRRLPLTALPLGGARVRDVSVEVGDEVTVRASVGRA